MIREDDSQAAVGGMKKLKDETTGRLMQLKDEYESETKKGAGLIQRQAAINEKKIQFQEEKAQYELRV